MNSRLISDGRHECLLCPHHCKLRSGQAGLCMARSGSDNGVILQAYGSLTGLAVEPIEKKPFYHYCPGMKTLSIGGWGCPLDCGFCANFTVSQKDRSADSKVFSPEELVKIALEKQCDAICFTYNEPIIYFEYVLDVSALCKIHGLKLILKTSGYAETEPWLCLCESADAINIDWKGSTERYRQVARVKPFPIFDRIQEAIKSGVHVEVSVPVYHDSQLNEYEEFRSFLTNVSPSTPVHLLKIVPSYRFDHVSLTSDFLLYRLHSYLSEQLSYVYIANLFGADSKYRDTLCKGCGEVMVERKSLQSKMLKTDCCDLCPIYTAKSIRY